MGNNQLDLSNYHNTLGRKHQLIRVLWGITWALFGRWLPRSFGRSWKLFLLRLFGAKVHKTANVYSSARIYYPANLIMEEYSCIASHVTCYNVALIKIGAHSTVSQGAYLCTASHDIEDPRNRLIMEPITIEDQVWIATDAFVGMGVTISQGAVVGARAAVFKDVEPWAVMGGNPARYIKKREIKDC